MRSFVSIVTIFLINSGFSTIAQDTKPSAEAALQGAGGICEKGVVMADILITQTEAEALIQVEKERINDQNWEYPGLGGSICVPLVSVDNHENFLLDISRGRINLKKGNYQNRAKQVIVLVRLDFGGAPHRNPDGQEIGTPHLHFYKEGYGDKYANPVPKNDFPNLNDPWSTLLDFMKYCNIVNPPKINMGLFS